VISALYNNDVSRPPTTFSDSYRRPTPHAIIERFVQLDSYIFVMCHDEIFQQITMDGRTDGWMDYRFFIATDSELWNSFIGAETEGRG